MADLARCADRLRLLRRSTRCMAGATSTVPRSSRSATAIRSGSRSSATSSASSGATCDAGELFARRTLDFVDIATTVPSHRALVEMAAANRVPAICQKPFAPSLDDAKAMVAACAEAGVPLMVHENFRWQSPIQAVKRDARHRRDRQAVLRHASRSAPATTSSPASPISRQASASSSRISASTSSTSPASCSATSTTLTARTARVNPNIAGEDVATMLLDHEDGATSVVDCSYATKLAVEPFPETLVEIDGSEGTIRLAAGLSADGHRQAAAPGQRCLAAAAALGVAALAQHPGKRRRDPAALGRLPAKRPRAGDLRAPTISRPSRLSKRPIRARRAVSRWRSRAC